MAEAQLSAFYPFSLEKRQRKGNRITRGKHIIWQSATRIPENLFCKVNVHSLIGKSRTDTSAYEKIALHQNRQADAFYSFSLEAEASHCFFFTQFLTIRDLIRYEAAQSKTGHLPGRQPRDRIPS